MRFGAERGKGVIDLGSVETDPRSMSKPCSIQRNRAKRSLREPYAGVDTLVIPLDTMKANDDAVENVFDFC